MCRPVPVSGTGKSLLGRVVGVVAITVFVAYTLVRRIIFKSPVSQGAFSLVAVVA